MLTEKKELRTRVLVVEQMNDDGDDDDDGVAGI